MSGEKNLVETKLEEIGTQIDDIEKLFSIKNIIPNVEAERLLSLSESEFSSMTPEECVSAKYQLLQHSMSMQKKLNRAITIKNWAERAITIILAKEYANIDQYATYEVKRAIVSLNNSYAEKLKDISSEQQIIIDTLSNMVMSCNNIANSFGALISTKRRIDYEYS